MKVLMIGTGWTVFDDERRDGLMRLWVDGWDLNILDECNYDGIIQKIENMMMIPIPLRFIGIQCVGAYYGSRCSGRRPCDTWRGVRPLGFRRRMWKL
jgi:hypothetical protein